MASPGTAFEDIGQYLTDLQFTLVEDVYDAQAFGSRYVIYHRGDHDIRLIWDGKEEWLLLESGVAAKNTWSELRLERIGRATATPENLTALRAALEQIEY